MLKGWLDEIETEVIGYLRDHQSASLHDLASGLRISEALALSDIGILAREGKVTIGGLDIRGQSTCPPFAGHHLNMVTGQLPESRRREMRC
jgi:hypothetical protein